MKKIAVSCFYILMFSVCFGGSFVSNMYIRGSSPENIGKIIIDDELQAYLLYDEKLPMQSVLCGKNSDTQDFNFAVKLAKKISGKLNSIVLVSQVYDGDILAMVLLENGEIVFQYNSFPGYFEGADKNPLIEGMNKLSETFKADSGNLKKIFEKDKNGEYVFAEEMLFDLVTLLKLPEYIAGVTYLYLYRGNEYIDTIREYYNITVTRY